MNPNTIAFFMALILLRHPHGFNCFLPAISTFGFPQIGNPRLSFACCMPCLKGGWESESEPEVAKPRG
jgi:hypothetical protein